MTLRKVPGALALGLLASLVAHTAIYGREHMAGGNYHGLLLEMALSGAVALVAAALLLGLTGARTTLNGSVLAARLTARLPGFGSLLTSTVLCYVAIESLEPHHANGSLLGAGLCLAVVSWLVTGLSRRFCALVAATVLRIFRAAFSARTFSWFVSPLVTSNRRRVLCAHRRFARPPPAGSFAGA